jgi:hypothetical protein
MSNNNRTLENGPAVDVHDWLKEDVAGVFGRRILTARDCQQLSDDIFSRISVAINYNTLRRFFGIVRSTYPPSAATLDILARYCGFDSAGDFASYKGKMYRSLNDDEQGMVRFLSAVFRSTPTASINDGTFLAVVRQAIDYVNDHPAVADKLQRAIAKTKNGQDFYFEQFVNIDKLNSHYGAGLLYYLAEKATPEAKIFAHALLCQRGWLSGKLEEVVQQYEEVMRVPLTPDIHPFVCGRYFATRLYHAEALSLPTEPVLRDAAAFHKLLPRGGDNYRLFPCFEYSFVIPLTFTGHFKQAQHYLDYAFAEYTGAHTYLDPGLYHTLELCRGITLAGLGEKERAEEVFKSLRPSEFYFLTRRTNMIQYLLLAKELDQPIREIDGQLNDLLAETGFVRLKDIFRGNAKADRMSSFVYSLAAMAGSLGSELLDAGAAHCFGF